MGSLVEALADAWGVEAESFGSTTFRRADRESGFEPDECFYIQNADSVIDHDTIDLEAGDLPPDLIIEIEVTTPALAKFPIYAPIGVPEVWRVDRNGSIFLYVLAAQGVYEAVGQSRALPRLSAASLQELIDWSEGMHRLAWLRRVRAWAHEQVAF